MTPAQVSDDVSEIALQMGTLRHEKRRDRNAALSRGCQAIDGARKRRLHDFEKRELDRKLRPLSSDLFLHYAKWPCPLRIARAVSKQNER